MNIDNLRNITYGMYIVSTKYKEKLAGCVVNTITQITSDNPILSVSINKFNFTNILIKKSKKIAISILSEKTNKDTIVKFGYSSSKDTNKFDESIFELIDGIPVVTDSICGYIIGDVIDVIDAETHDIFLIRLKISKQLSSNTPMTYNYYHVNLKGTSPKNAPTYIKQQSSDKDYNRYECIVCGHIYDESIEKIKFNDLDDDWVCPVCGVTKDKFKLIK